MSDAQKIEVLVPEDQLMARIDELADRLAPRLTGDWTVVSILIGATPFTSDLMKALARRGVHPMLDVIWLESYRDARESSGRVVVRADLSRQVKDRGVLLLDDVFDTGRTLEVVRALLPRAHIATVYAKPKSRALVQTFVTEVSQDTWIYFPWDLALQYVEPYRGR